MSTKNPDEIKKTVRDVYSKLAEQRLSCCAPKQESTCGCGCSPVDTHARVLYSREELESIAVDVPSLGCGNPIALSELKPGEAVLDLGSGGGLDCFLAAKKVGNKGKVIGLDMTPEMIRQARANAEKQSLDNVEFRLGEMEHMPVDSDSVDVVISNCVINLSPDKDAVFREIYRVLRPGGRLCVSDIVTRGELPQSVRDDLSQWAACVGGALDEKVYLQKIRDAGFKQPKVVQSKADSSTGGCGCCGTPTTIISIAVTAYKPQ